jgi:hypothetical protein
MASDTSGHRFIRENIMAKIERKNQKIFAAQVSPSGTLSQFGSLRNTTPNYSSDPDVIQALDAWVQGWSSAVISGYLPTLQDLNSLYYVLTRQIAYLMQSGIPEWNEGITYYIGSIVSDGVGGIYVSVANDNVNFALSQSNKWLNYGGVSQTNIGANYSVINTDTYIRWSTAATTAGERTVTLPAPIASMRGRNVLVKVISATTGGDVLVVTQDASLISGKSSIAIKRYESKNFFCDGIRWICTSDFIFT